MWAGPSASLLPRRLLQGGSRRAVQAQFSPEAQCPLALGLISWLSLLVHLSHVHPVDSKSRDSGVLGKDRPSACSLGVVLPPRHCGLQGRDACEVRDQPWSRRAQTQGLVGG